MDDHKKGTNAENRSSFKGRKKLLKTLSLFSTSLTPPGQRKSDNQKCTASSNLLKNSMNLDAKGSFGTSQCQDIHNWQDTRKEQNHCLG